MFRRIFLGLAFVTALGVIGIGMADTAGAHGGRFFGSRLGHYGGYAPGMGGGYAAAGYRMTGFYPGNGYAYGSSANYLRHAGQDYHYDLIPHYNHFDVVPHYGRHHHGGIYIGF